MQRIPYGKVRLIVRTSTAKMPAVTPAIPLPRRPFMVMTHDSGYMVDVALDAMYFQVQRSSGHVFHTHVRSCTA
jgi:hypothetical protein